jgi:hypothetical protein
MSATVLVGRGIEVDVGAGSSVAVGDGVGVEESPIGPEQASDNNNPSIRNKAK